MFELIVYSLVVGMLGGGCIAAGAARMFHAPQAKALGAFRTMGEMNACNGDPTAHFTFGLGYFISSLCSAATTGILGQDVLQRVIPNWSSAILLSGNKEVEETLQNPGKMFWAGAFVGGVAALACNLAAALLPMKLTLIVSQVLTPAMGWLINPVMPAVFWLAALDAGKRSGLWATVFGGLSMLWLGNALPGILLGTLVGKALEERGR